MKAVIGYFDVRCGTCGRGLFGEQHWFEAPHIIVQCRDQDCPENGKKWKLPITRVELEPFDMDAQVATESDGPLTDEEIESIKASLPGGVIPERWK